MDFSRRRFLIKTGVAGLSGLPLAACAGEAAADHHAPPADDGMGVLVDLTRCNGCRRCEAACLQANGFDAPSHEELKDTSVFAEHRRPGTRSYTTVNQFHPFERDRAEASIFVKSNCLHCLDPACVSACLVKAMEKQPNGAVTYDPWKCMGCRYCMVACPFQIPAYEYNKVLTPQVRKCTFCMNEGNPNAGGVPACVQACPMESLTYGRRSDLLVTARGRIERDPDRYINHIYGEHEAGGTSWLYVSGVPFEKLGFLNIGSNPSPRLTEAIQHAVFKHFMPPIAWCAILGMAMWLTRPDGRGGSRESGGETCGSEVSDANLTPEPAGARS